MLFRPCILDAAVLDPPFFRRMIADYYQSIEPAGLLLLFRIMASYGIEPIMLSKIIVVGWFCDNLRHNCCCFAFSMTAVPVPFAAFIRRSFDHFLQRLESSATRGLSLSVFLGFLIYFTRRSMIGCVVMIALCGLFYPPILFIVSGVLVLSLLRWEGRRVRLTRDRSCYWLSLTGLAVVLVMMSAFALKSSHVIEVTFMGNAAAHRAAGPSHLLIATTAISVVGRSAGFSPYVSMPILCCRILCRCCALQRQVSSCQTKDPAVRCCR